MTHSRVRTHAHSRPSSIEFLPRGVALTYTPEDTAKGNAWKTDKKLSAYDSDAAATISFLQAHPHCSGAIGTAGFCIGGALAFRCATHPAIKAACCWCVEG